MHICIFEDTEYKNLEPLVFSRPVYDLLFGFDTLRNRILREFKTKNYSLQCRNYLAESLKNQNHNILVNEIHESECLFINGRIFKVSELVKILPKKFNENIVYTNGKTIFAAFIKEKTLEEINLNNPLSLESFRNIKQKNIELKTINFIWDLIKNNGQAIIEDFNKKAVSLKKKKTKKILGKIYDGVNIVNKKNVIISKGSVIKPGVVLDASEGPIFIDQNVLINSNSVIEGPVYIGKNSKINSFAHVYENVSIGQVCKIGGEVEDSIFMPFSNKQHSGFIGHAYIGSWVNLGADTNCSDLKNNYGTVKAYAGGNLVDSGSQFLGVIMGDHSKTSINSMLNTGTVIGFSCNIFGSGFPDKYIPSFSWGGSDSMMTYNVEKSIETAKKVLSRRKIDFTISEENLFNEIFKLTKQERIKRGYLN